MTHEEIHQRIKKAAHHAVPDQLDAILSACEEQKGTVIAMTNQKKHRWLAPLSAVAALAIVAGSIFGVSRFQQASATDSVVTLDINPSISLSIDAKETVLEAIPLNDDAKEVMGGMELEGTNLETAVNALIGACLQKGYLDELENAILVSVENSDAAKATQLQSELTATISGAFQSGAILTQNVTVSDELAQLAQQYNISAGKASLIQEVIAQDSTLTFDSLAPLSMSEISLIASSRNLTTTGVSQTGSTSDQAYIGQDAALQAACDHAGIATSDVQGLSTEFGWSPKGMVYELDFCSGGTEYEYKINATDGSVVKNEQEPCDHTWHTSSGNNGTQGTTAFIGESAATTAALTHAKVDQSAAQSLTVKLDEDDGVTYYEIEFCSAGVEYDYEINATTGDVVKFEQDTCDHYAHRSASNSTTNQNQNQNQGTSTGSYIGYDAALQAACKHAGVDASQVSRLENELDHDDGVACYEISFHYNGMEYDYEIQATNGQVLKYESEWDD
ncbi:MAG TPA: PepSY domain-containing protein [Candidatus Enterenecus avicola]|nr:PepSY domain-containing protein [Candidatus Enterenecus avicola]